MTDFKFKSTPPEFKLGINGMGIKTLPRDLSPFYKADPIKQVGMPQPNLFFTPIEDNRDQILEQMKMDLENQLNFTKNTLPRRY